MEIIINEDKLNDKEVEEIREKVRVLLFDKNDNILIANYGDVFLLPGGKIDKNESFYDAIKRELYEELGKEYTSNELEYLGKIDYYQKDYIKREGIKLNRKVVTRYFTGKYKGIETKNLSNKEIDGKFTLKLVPFSKLEEIVKNSESNNPRNRYFKRELLAVLEIYNNKKNRQKDRNDDF